MIERISACGGVHPPALRQAIFIAILFAASAVPISAQTPQTIIPIVSTAQLPASCGGSAIGWLLAPTGVLYTCQSGTPTVYAGGGGGAPTGPAGGVLSGTYPNPTSPLSPQFKTVAFSTTPTFTCTSTVSDTFKITLTGNVTSSTLSGCTAGEAVSFQIFQDGTGSRTFVYPANVLTAPTIIPDANLYTAFSCPFDGTNCRTPPTNATYSYLPTAVAPSTNPATGLIKAWIDSTDLMRHERDSNGNINSLVRTASSGCAAGSWVDYIAATGLPHCTALSLTAAQVPIALRTKGLSYPFSNGGSALLVNTTGYFTVPFACTIAAYDILVDTGTATVKTWRVATGTAIPTSGNSISTAGVAISTGTAVRSTTVTDFTSTAIVANDILAYSITTVSGPTFLNFTLECTQ